MNVNNVNKNLERLNSKESKKSENDLFPDDNLLASDHLAAENAPLPFEQKHSSNFLLPASIIIASVILGGALVYTAGLRANQNSNSRLSSPVWLSNKPSNEGNSFEIQSKNKKGVVLPIKWGDLGEKLVEAGVIDLRKLESVYAERGGLSEEERELLEGKAEKIIVNENNAGFILNLLWAFGLSNKNRILEEGPMNNPQYGGPENFASTGGWTLAKGSPMDHYSRHTFVSLTAKQQFLVEKASQNIYRPCCNNSTYFPDCNHGMAMLGLLELMAANNLTEEEMYKVALQVNSLWFPDTYAAIEQFLSSKGYSSNQVAPQEILGQNFSSASGYRQILSEITPSQQKKGGSSCGV